MNSRIAAHVGHREPLGDREPLGSVNHYSPNRLPKTPCARTKRPNLLH